MDCWVDSETNREERDDIDRRQKYLSPFVGVVFIAIIAAGAIVSAAAIPNISVSEEHRVVDGGWTTAFQRSYEDALPIKEAALHGWSALRYRLFGQGTEGVVVGRNGWLFTTEELSIQRGDTDRTRLAIEEIRATARFLEQRDAVLVVALVPAKARVLNAYLPGFSYPDELTGQYAEVRAALGDEPSLLVPDLLKPLTALQRRADAPDAYLHTDTHWTPAGARVAAEVIASSLIAFLDERGVPRTTFEVNLTGRSRYEGDLLRFIPVGPYAPLFDLDTGDEIGEYETLSADGGGGLFSDPVIPGALAGTSYSAGERWNFEGFLKAALAADLVNVSIEGEGPFVPMREYLSSATFREFPPQFVVWEIPERYLPRYEAAGDGPDGESGENTNGGSRTTVYTLFHRSATDVLKGRSPL